MEEVMAVAAVEVVAVSTVFGGWVGGGEGESGIC